VVAAIAAGALLVYGGSAREIVATVPPAGSSAAAPSPRELAEALLTGASDGAAPASTITNEPVDDVAADVLDDASGASWDSAYRGFVEAPVIATASSRATAWSEAPEFDEEATATPAPEPVDDPAAAPAAGATSREMTAAAEQPAVAPASTFRLTLAPANLERDEFADAVAAQARRDHPRAVDLYLELLRRRPGHAEAANNLGTSYHALGELDRARDSYRRAIAIQPGYAAAWSNLSGVLAALGQPEEARTALAQSIRLDPSNLAAKVNLANERASRGASAEARILLEEVLRSDPEMAEAHYALARVLEARGDPSAIAEYRRFLETADGHFPGLMGPVRERIAQLEKGF
jgi:tetratricopeptide (TPR) repeat protein